MKTTMRLVTVVLCGMALAGCGGGGAATPEGVGDAIMGAIEDEDFAAIYRQFPAWQIEGNQQAQDHEKFTAETTSDWWAANRERLASGGDQSLDPGKKLNIDSEEKYFNLDASTRAALVNGWYQRAHKWEKFTERMADMRLIGVQATHGLEGDGQGSLRYRNRYGDRLEVQLRRIGNVWYCVGVAQEGNEQLPVKE